MHIVSLKKYRQYCKKKRLWLIFPAACLCVAGLGFTGFYQRPHLLSYVDSQGKIQPVKTEIEWHIKRRQILDSMQAAMGPLPRRKNLPPMSIQYTDTVDGDGYVRYTINFTVAVNERLPAYLYVPLSASKYNKRPAMLALHPTGMAGKKIVDGQGSLSNRGYAKELAERGYVVIAPDYPGFGDLKDYDFNKDRYLSGTMKSIFDDMRCIDLLQARNDVDGDKIGVIGHSLGGHSAMFVGAFDTRLKVIVSSCGWTLMHDYFNGDTLSAQKYGGRLWPWAQERYMPLVRIKYGLDADKIPFDFDEVIAAIAPRTFFSNSPLYDVNFNVNGVKKGIKKASEVYHFLGAKNALIVHYPTSKHDFPLNVRLQAYHFIDSIFNVKSAEEITYSYLDNAGYLQKVRSFSKDNGRKNIVMLGNSLTARGHWPDLLGRTDVANRGIGSDITSGYIHRINYVFNLKPKVCFIEGGVNDLAHDIAMNTIVKNLAVLIDTLRDKKIIPVLNAVTLVTSDYRYIDPEQFNHKIEMLNEAIRQLAKRKRVQLIDLNPEISDDGFLLKKYAVKDGIHYTAGTYLLWREKITKILEDLGLDK